MPENMHSASEITASSKPRLIKEEEVTKERFVLFLDILGFKDRVARHSHDEVMRVLQELQQSVSDSRKKHAKENIDYSIFSDSILLFTQDATADSLVALSAAACDIMQTAILKAVPMKGALAMGKMSCDTPKQLFFGQPLIDAYLLEESTKYYGILVHHSAEEAVKKQGAFYRDVPACLKCGNVNHYELNWHSRNEGVHVTDILEALEKLRQTVSDEPRKYIDNTKAIINTK